jgi:2-polyprenyl-3-methyl-5-hydroxy-6-metoxy-1,4-benzoquinol methylase
VSAGVPDSARAAAGRALKDELRAASASFRKRDKRHFLATPDVIYCAFSTPAFSVAREEAQRDASRRLYRFGLGEADVRGKRVLDLGSNNGAMLFQLSNFGPASGLGVEFDAEKVDLARRIAAFAGLTGLEFRQADVDQLEAKDLGPPFDVVLCLALEAHVQKPKRLYPLLAELTRGKLYFEANASTKPKEVESRLRDAGFTDIRNLGVCDDDIVPRNNRRPIFTAVRS